MTADSTTAQIPDTPVRLVLVDDHTVVRAGIRRMLEESGEIATGQPKHMVVGEAGTLANAFEVAEIHRPDIIVLDIDLPDGDGLQAVEKLRQKGRGSRILVLSMHDDPEHVETSFAAGADGYLVKDAAESELIAAIAAIGRGERYLYPPLGAALARAATAPPKDPLTDRERDVVALLVRGHTNSEVAKLLHLSVRTVETHRAHAVAKLRVDTRAELVEWALERGLLEPSRN